MVNDNKIYKITGDFVVARYLSLKNVLNNLKSIYSTKGILYELAKNDFKSKYANSYLGFIWGFVHPLLIICVYWFVFQVGFRSGNLNDGTPFILWLSTGLIPWFFFSEAINSATNSLIEYSYLVKKVVFKVSTLSIIKISTAFVIHLFFILLLIMIFLFYGYYPEIIWIQLIYYLFCSLVLVIGLGWFFSSIVPFFRDTIQLVAVILQLGFWLTPIIWDLNIIPDKLEFIFRINPMYYIIQGFRDTFINHIWFWERNLETLVFWFISIIILFLGINIFKRLKPHFSDVL